MYQEDEKICSKNLNIEKNHRKNSGNSSKKNT